MKRHWNKNLIYYIVLLISLPTLYAIDEIDFDKYLDNFDLIEQDFGTLDIGEINRVFSPQDSITQLIDVLKAHIILQEDLYKRTHPINTRAIHDFPHFYIDTCCLFPCSWRFSVQPFFHFTLRGNFTKNSKFIRSYIALDNPNILQQLDELNRDSDTGEKQFDIPEILGLFEPLKIQERRAGFMFSGEKNLGCWSFWIKAPIIYLERNVFLTDSEKKAIEDADIFDDNDPTTDLEEQQMKFARKHFIGDKIGIGDTRFRFGYNIIDKSENSLTLGGEITLPTAFAFAKGLYGLHFSKNTPNPEFNIFENLQLIFCLDSNLNKVKKNVEEFLLGAIDRLSAIVIEQKLGNGGHIGLAGFARSDLQVTDCLWFASYGALEYLLPASERRFYIKKKKQSDFIDRNYQCEGIDDEQCEKLSEANLAFINQQLIDTLFPKMYETTIFPGFVFKLGAWLNYQTKFIDFTFGYDLWWQEQEKLGKIKAPKNVKNILRTDIAQKPGAMQHKIFSGINYIHKRENYEWCLGIFADTTFFQFGIGKDFGISLKYEMSV